MKIVIPGGSGEVGSVLATAFHRDGHDVVVLSRSASTSTPWRTAAWDGKTLGDWASEIDDADVIINLAGRSVNCRYTEANKAEIMRSRLDSTKVLGDAVNRAANPPRVWLQASTATIYSHRYDASNDEITGIIGGSEPDAPAKWRFSIEVATAWENALNEIDLPQTRKVLMRISILMSPLRGGTFDLLLKLVRIGLGGKAGDGRQFVSWIHADDLVRSVYWLIEHGQFVGPVNLASPNPLPNADFMRAIRRANGTSFGLPAFKWQVELGTFFMRSESELVLKSRRVLPKLLTDSGFRFEYPEWQMAAEDLVRRWREAG